MKKIILSFITAVFAVGIGTASPKITINAESAKKSYGNTVTISPNDKTVKITKDKIIITAKKEGAEYFVSGYFKGQIVNKTRNTTIKLNGAFIENTSGEAAIYGEVKTEISTTGGTENYVVSSGKNASKTAALQCAKNLEIGGSGTLYIVGNVYHAVKADDVKMKGSGTFYLQGTDEGSGINGDSFLVEKDKTFKAYFVNSKNGIKADDTISISSGNFFFYDNKAALKTDTKKDDEKSGKKPNPKRTHGITLSGGTITASGNENLYKTEKGAYKVSKAKIIEE